MSHIIWARNEKGDRAREPPTSFHPNNFYYHLKVYGGFILKGWCCIKKNKTKQKQNKNKTKQEQNKNKNKTKQNKKKMELEKND